MRLVQATAHFDTMAANLIPAAGKRHSAANLEFEKYTKQLFSCRS
jgi:hypothetical protein